MTLHMKAQELSFGIRGRYSRSRSFRVFQGVFTGFIEFGGEGFDCDAGSDAELFAKLLYTFHNLRLLEKAGCLSPSGRLLRIFRYVIRVTIRLRPVAPGREVIAELFLFNS